MPSKTQLNMLWVILLLTFSPQRAMAENLSSDGQEKATLKYDPQRYTKGLKLYQQHCAACHGKQGQGATNWQQRDAEGNFRAPPLNGTGHTWHHPQHVLMDIIRNGTMRLGGNMPAWKDKLSDSEIETILYWTKSQWPREIYQAWHRNNVEVKQHQKQREE